jgi:hypothetical protein
VPAAYAQDSSDPGNYGDYDVAGRPDQMLAPGGQPASMKINYIIIHDAEGSYGGTISTFQNPASYVSANYVVRSSDGAVTEMVRPSDVSWGAGDWYINMRAINIENEGFAGPWSRSWKPGRDLGEIYARADADGISTEQAAERLAVSHLG